MVIDDIDIDSENKNDEEVIEELSAKLEFYKPPLDKMLQEIAQAGVSIKLDNADSNYFAQNRTRIISSMWKMVRIAKILKKPEIAINLNILDNAENSSYRRIH